MSTETRDHLDDVLDAFYNMVDALDDMWWEEEYSNVKEVWKIKEERYLPARDAVKESLRRAIQQEIRRLS